MKALLKIIAVILSALMVVVVGPFIKPGPVKECPFFRYVLRVFDALACF